jgi:hypothetical protein
MLKPILLITSFFFISLGAFTQIPKGSVFIGGDISFFYEEGTSNNSNDYVDRNFYVLPVFGKAVKENLLIGVLSLFYHNNTDVTLDFNDLKQSRYGLGFFAREYKQIAKTRFHIFLQESLSGEYDHTEQGFNTADKIDKKSHIINLGVYPGIAYNLSQRLQLESGFSNLLGLRYYHTKTFAGTINPISSKVNGISLYATADNVTQFYVGFRLFFLKQ